MVRSSPATPPGGVARTVLRVLSGPITGIASIRRQQRHLAAEPAAVDQRRAGDGQDPGPTAAGRWPQAERVAHHVHRPGFPRASRVSATPRAKTGRADRLARAIGEPEPGHVEGDHPVACGQPLGTAGPVLQAAADAVDPAAPAGCPGRRRPGPGCACRRPRRRLPGSRPGEIRTRPPAAVPNRSAASSTGPFRSRAWSALKFISTVHGPLVPCCGNSSIARMMAAGREVQHRALLDHRVVDDRHHGAVAVLVHVGQQAAQVLARRSTFSVHDELV